MNITIYTKPDCVQCDQTKKYFDRNEIAYETIDITQNPEAYEYVKSLGFSSAPVVVADGDSWAGFKLERIKNAIARAREKKALE